MASSISGFLRPSGRTRIASLLNPPPRPWNKQTAVGYEQLPKELQKKADAGAEEECLPADGSSTTPSADSPCGGVALIGQLVTVCGWSRTVRKQGGGQLCFISLNDGSSVKSLQVVVESTLPNFDQLLKCGVGCSFKCTGEIVKSPAEGQLVEMCCRSCEAGHSLEILGTADAGKYPLAKKHHSREFLREIGHLRARTLFIGAVVRVRTQMAAATHSFFLGRDFQYIHTPIITGADCEGAGEMFAVTRLLPEPNARCFNAAKSTKPAVETAAAINQAGGGGGEGEGVTNATEKKREIGLEGNAAAATVTTTTTNGAVEVADASKHQSATKKDAGSSSGDTTTTTTTTALYRLPLSKNSTIDYKQDFFGRPTFLTVSGQLAVENYCHGVSDVYTFGPTFRAENSHTSRHLSEFWMVEPELAFADLHDNMNCAEDYLKFCVQWALEKCRTDVEWLDDNAAATSSEKEGGGLVKRLEHLLKEPFGRITYTEAIELLLPHSDKFSEKVEWGLDMGSEHERFLTEHIFNKPVIVYNYPKDFKAFYMRLNDDNKTVAAMDVLLPYIGEVIGGSQREERLDVLDKMIEEKGLNKKDYWFYRDLRQFGSMPHCGFGLGFERLVMLVSGVDNIRDVIPYPRYPMHADF
eukprot:GHVS01096142.1.p1 GENE.GHVS01096142.1~~GHVS01096142.1.p1  ORF type:complete len:639 (+),score=138.47 GHVS01096142.1:72-1988(+)